MTMSMGICYESQTKVIAEYACARLHETFPGVVSNVHALLEVPPEAFDTSTGQYDVHFLLDMLTVPQPYDKMVWIIERDIGDFWHKYLFGAALGTRAVVSAARLSDGESVAKEVCHEVGHMLGLKHCQRHCCMRNSWTDDAVKVKPNILCEDCQKALGLETITSNGQKI